MTSVNLTPINPHNENDKTEGSETHVSRRKGIKSMSFLKKPKSKSKKEEQLHPLLSVEREKMVSVVVNSGGGWKRSDREMISMKLGVDFAHGNDKNKCNENGHEGLSKSAGAVQQLNLNSENDISLSDQILFRNWINFYLNRQGKYIGALKDLQNECLLICQFIEELSNKNEDLLPNGFSSTDVKEDEKIDLLVNHLKSLKGMENENFSISKEDMLHGSENQLMEFLLNIARILVKIKLQKENEKLHDIIFNWCLDVIKNVDENISKDILESGWKSQFWGNGLAFCAILQKFKPELIDVRKLAAKNKLSNLQFAFLISQQLGIPPLIKAEMMQNLDPNSLELYIASMIVALTSND